MYARYLHVLLLSFCLVEQCSGKKASTAARSAENCREMMERADADENDGVSYDEFVEWLERNDPGPSHRKTIATPQENHGKMVV